MQGTAGPRHRSPVFTEDPELPARVPWAPGYACGHTLWNRSGPQVQVGEMQSPRVSFFQ